MHEVVQSAAEVVNSGVSMSTFITGLIIFILTYVLIISEKLPDAVSAMLGGLAMIMFGVINDKQALDAIELDVVFLLAGMMIVVHIMSETGVFQWVAIKIAKFVKGEPFPLMLLLVLITAVFSALLDNVTTILLIAPVSILLAEQLEIDAIPFLIAEAIASNIGGTATLIGDPPNILIGTAANLSFNDFLFNLGPIVVINLIFLFITFWFMFGRKLRVSRDLKARIMELDTKRALKDEKLLKKSGIIMILILIGFLTHGITHVGPSIISMTGAVVLMAITKKDPEEIFKVVEWKTLFFFIGLFMMVEGVVEIGFIKMMADKALEITKGDLATTSVILLWLSAIASSIVNNIPYTATLIPMLNGDGGLITRIATNSAYTTEMVKYALWWSLALGTCFGGNATLIGASANVVAAGIAEKSGRKISFMRFTKYGLIIMIQSMILATLYVWFRYLPK